MSNRLRAERENACDDFAADLAGGKSAYARVLLNFEEHRNDDRFCAAAALNADGTIHRVARLIRLTFQPASPDRLAPFSGVVALAAILAMAQFSVGLLPADVEKTNVRIRNLRRAFPLRKSSI